MMTWRAIVPLLPCLMVLGVTGAGRGSDGTDELQGCWNVTKVVVRGKPLPPDVKGTAFVFERDSLRIVPPEQAKVSFPKQTMRFSANPQTEPKSIDTTNLDGIAKGRSIAGIYRIEGDILTLCIPLAPGIGRPTSFESDKKSNLAVYTLERSKSPAPSPGSLRQPN